VIDGIPPTSLRRMVPDTLPTPAIDAVNCSDSAVPAGIEFGVVIDVKSGAEPARFPEKLMIPAEHGDDRTAIMVVVNTARLIVRIRGIPCMRELLRVAMLRKLVPPSEKARGLHHRQPLASSQGGRTQSRLAGSRKRAGRD
jgi:hypothetical protein